VGGVVQLGTLWTAATNRPIVPAPGDYDDGEIVEWLAGETEVLGENLPQCRFVHHKSHMLPGRVSVPAPNRLGYGTAFALHLLWEKTMRHRLAGT
jgi:hypothetical protein